MEMQIPVRFGTEGASDSPFLTSSQPRPRALITAHRTLVGACRLLRGPSQGDRCQQVLPLH